VASKLSHLFDIRNVIGALMAIYGVVLTIAGFAPGLLREREKGATNNPVDLYFGTDANWWVGLALIVVAIVFFAWAWLRPVRVEEETTEPAST
jgi:preprotein translocase subunit SecY